MKRFKFCKLFFVLLITIAFAFCLSNLCDNDELNIGLFVACVPPSFYQLAAPMSYSQSISLDANLDIDFPQLIISYLAMHEKSPPRFFVSILA
jgi:hypothetical protein